MSIQDKYIWRNKQMQTQTKVVALHYTLNILPIMWLATPSITTYTQNYTTRLFQCTIPVLWYQGFFNLCKKNRPKSHAKAGAVQTVICMI